LYYIEIFLLRILFWVLTSYHIQGLENIPRKGPLLILSNHLSIADPPALGIFLPRRSIFMAKEELFQNMVLGFFVKSFGAFPVFRGSSNRQALRQATTILESGQTLIMFPEGKRSRNGGLQSGLPGSALIAYHNKVPVLPVGITGTENIRGGLGWIWHRPRINITIGQAFSLPDSGYSLTREELSGYTELIMKQIAALLPKKYRGKYTENN
jgi:1-acyl-sn-glycerol-3-phosphate acyltransferase